MSKDKDTYLKFLEDLNDDYLSKILNIKFNYLTLGHIFYDILLRTDYRVDILANILSRRIKFGYELFFILDKLTMNELNRLFELTKNRKVRIYIWYKTRSTRTLAILLNQGLEIRKIKSIFTRILNELGISEYTIEREFCKKMADIKVRDKNKLVEIIDICLSKWGVDHTRTTLQNNFDLFMESLPRIIEKLSKEKRALNAIPDILVSARPDKRRIILGAIKEKIPWYELTAILFHSIEKAIKENYDLDYFYEALYEAIKGTHEVSIKNKKLVLPRALAYLMVSDEFYTAPDDPKKLEEELFKKFCWIEDPENVRSIPAYLLIEAFKNYLARNTADDEYAYTLIKEITQFFRDIRCGFWQGFLLLRIFDTIKDHPKILQRIRDYIKDTITRIETLLRNAVLAWEKIAKEDLAIEIIAEETSEGYESLYWALRLPIWRNYLSDVVTLLVALVYANDLESISQLISYITNGIQKDRSIVRYAIELINAIYWVLPGSLKEQLKRYIHEKYRELVRQDPDLLDPENFKGVAFYNVNVFVDFFLTKADVSYIAERGFLEPKHIYWILDRAKEVDHRDIDKLLKVLYRPIFSIDKIEIYRPKNKEIFSLVSMLLRKTTNIENTLLTLESFVEKLFRVYMTLLEAEIINDYALVMFLATLKYLIKGLRLQAPNQYYWDNGAKLGFEVSMLINMLIFFFE